MAKDLDTFSMFPEEDEWAGMPEFSQPGGRASFREITVRFHNQADFLDFCARLDREPINPKVDKIFFPKHERGLTSHWYIADESDPHIDEEEHEEE